MIRGYRPKRALPVDQSVVVTLQTTENANSLPKIPKMQRKPLKHQIPHHVVRSFLSSRPIMRFHYDKPNIRKSGPSNRLTSPPSMSHTSTLAPKLLISSSKHRVGR